VHLFFNRAVKIRAVGDEITKSRLDVVLVGVVGAEWEKLNNIK
jgi:hypothetical protein